MCNELVGKRFGRLTIIDDLGVFLKEGTKTKDHYVKCICDCGNEKIVRLSALKDGSIKSCGCLSAENRKLGQKFRKHNEYEVFHDIVFVKFTNCDEYWICDLEDWDKLKDYSWAKDYKGYAIGHVNNKEVRFHRIVTNCPQHLTVDHIYGVKETTVCDNRKENLRVCTSIENSHNIPKFKHNKTGVRGVHKHSQTGKYVAQIRFKGKTYHLGCFDTLDEARKAREEKEIELFSDFSPLSKVV